MPDIPITVWVVAVLYAVLTTTLGERPDSPLIFRWPSACWRLMAHSWRRPNRKPDHAKIARLERELGMGDSDGRSET